MKNNKDLSFGQLCEKDSFLVHNTAATLVRIREKWNALDRDERKAIHNVTCELSASIDLLHDIEAKLQNIKELEDIIRKEWISLIVEPCDSTNQTSNSVAK